VANSTGSSVIKLRASDGTSLGTFAVGSVHDAIAFDGANLWVANAFTNTVSKL
jgi:DNA-binding beta-propeller fold protein YncE